MKKILSFLLATLLLTSVSYAAELSVEAAAVATGVDNLTPIGVSDKFPSSTKRLFCYTKIIGGEGQKIKHIWYLDGNKFAERALDIKGDRYRTYGVVSLPAGAKGPGKVDITTEDGKVLTSVDFVIE